MAKQLNYQVNLSVNKNDLNELLTALKQIQQDQIKALNLGTLTTNLDKAGDAAYRLEQILNKSWNSKIGQLDLSKLNAEIKNTYGSVSKLKENLESVGMGQYFNQLQSNVLNTNLQLKNTNKLLDAMATSMANTVKWGITSSIFNNITSQIQKAWSYSKSLDTSLNSIRIVTGKSADEMERYARVANKAAKELGQSTRDYTNASLIYYQQGLGEEEAQARTETTLKAANVTGQTGQEVSEQLTAVWNGYKVSAEETELYVDKLAAVAAGTASDLEELSTGMSKVASAANSAGVDIDQLNGILSTVISVTREAPETIGSAFKTIFARLGDLALDGKDEYGVTLGKVSGQLQELGIQVLTEKGELRDMGDIIEDTAAKWDTWTRAQKQAAAVAMAGKMQYSRLIALFDNWDMYSRAVEMSSNAIGTLQEQQDTYMESTEAHLQKLSTEAERTYDILFDTNAVNDMSDALTELLKIFNNFLSGMGGGLQTITGLTAMTGNIFNKQIGAGLNQLAQNREIGKQNEQAVNTALAFSQEAASKTNSEAESEVYESMRLKSQEILALKERISTEDMNRLLTLRKEAEQESLITAALEEQNARQTSMVAIENSLKNQSKLIKEQKREYAAITENVEIIEQKRGSRYVEDRNQMLESQRDILSRIVTMKDEELLTDEQISILEKAQQRDSQNRVLTKKQIADLQNISQQVIEQEVQEEKEITRQKELQQQLDSGALETQQIKSQQKQQALADAQANLERQAAIQDMVKGLTTLVTLGTTLSGIWKTINNEELTGWEKFEQISSTLLFTLPMIISGFSSIGKILPGINAMIGATATGTKVLGSSALAATIEIHGLKLAMWEVYLIIAAIVAIIGLVTVGIKALSDAYNADAIAAQQAAEAAQEAKKAFGDAKTAADNLKTTISDYTDALSQLKDLKSGTEEYTEALESANAKAKELIETFGLYDEAYTQNGMILFKDNSLENLQARADSAVKAAEAQRYSTQISANQAKLRSDQTDLRREIGLAFDPRGLANDVFVPITNNALAIVDDFKGATDEQVSDIINRLTKLKESNESAYIANTRNNEALEKWIQTEYQGNYEMQILSKSIGEQVNGFKNLIESTEQLTKANKYYIDQLNKAELENMYGQQLRGMSVDKYGRVDETKYQQMLDVLNNAPIQEQIKDMKAERRRIITDADLDKGKTWSGEFAAAMTGTLGTNETDLNKYLDEQLRAFGVSKEQVGEIKDNETLAREYAKVVLKMTEEQVNAMQFAKDKLKDVEGKEIVDVSNADERGAKRGAIFGTATAEAADQSINEMAQSTTQAVLNLENQLQMSATKAGEKYGADFSMALLNALSDPEHKIDLSKVTGIDEDEARKFANMSQEEFMQIFGLSNETLQMVGDATIEQLYQSFKESAANHKWDIDEEIAASMEKKNSDLEAFGSGLSKKKFAELEEDVRVYAKNLMEIAETSDEVADSLKHNSDAAVDFAFKVIKMNKAIDTLADNIKDWKDIISNSAEYSQEYAEAMYDIKNALADVYDTEADYISHSFIKNHLSEIEEIAKGSETAIEGLKDSLSEEIVANIIVENKLGENRDSLLADFVSLREQAQAAMSGLVIGDDILVDDTNFIAQLNQLINDCNMTVAQANAVFSALGIEPTYETETVQQEQSITPTQTKHEVIAASTKTFTASDGTVTEVPEYTAIDTVTPLAPVKADVEVPVMALAVNGKQPKISGIKKAPGGSANNYSSRNKGGKAPGSKSSSGKGGGGGSKAKNPAKEKKVESKKDPYHDIDIIIKDISHDLDKLQKQQSKFFGQKLIDNLNKQYELLNKQIDATTKKLGIARQEQARLASELSNKGVRFNADGTIANYAQAYDAQLGYVNGLINQYNAMTAEEQESFKETLEQAKEDFNKFTDSISEYDKTVTDIIPELESNIQDAVDKQIEIKIEEFTMEIKIRLDMSEAERDWNEFKRKVIDGIKDTDILGNTRARLRDFNSYYNSENTGEVQSLMKQVSNTQAQLEQMDRTGWSDFYGDNRAQALEDLKSYNDQLMKSMEDVEDLIDEIKKSYLDMMDEAADKFQDQVDMYNQVKDIIDHDMNIIKLVYGEDSYADLEKYYQMQEDNNNKQLDFLRQQKDFWYAQMQTLEQGSEEWEKAKENWMDAISEWNSKVEEAVENIQDKYLNTINKIFDELNNKVTSGAGLDYVSEEWELINQNADQYLDTINSLYGIQSLENKYLDAIDQTDNLSAQRKLNDLMNEELNALREKDKLTQYDIDRANMKYEIALKQIALEEAQQNKSTMRLRRDSQGNYTYQYVADNDQIGQLQDELTTLKNELYNFDLEHYRDNLDQVLEIYQEFQEKMKEAAQINDPEERAAMELLLQEQYGELINGLVEQNETIRLNLHESAFTELADLYNTDLNNFQSLTSEEQEVLLGQMIPQWDSGIQHMADTFAGEGGFVPTCKDAMEQLNAATETYEQDLNQVQQAAGQDFGDVQRGINDTKTKTEELIQDNGVLIQTYQDQLNEVRKVINELQSLCSQYNAVKIAAQQAAEAAYNYWRAVNGEAANAAGNNVSGGNSKSGNSSSNSRDSNTSSLSSGSGGAGSVGGDGATIGNQITYSGSYYYDSFGTKPSGSKYSGVADGVTIDIVNNNPYGIHIKSSDGRYPDLGWIKRNQVTRWNTGGYTGDWGDDSGRLAILDRKELILNKDDTANMLNILQLTRDFMNSMNNVLLSRMINSVNGAPNTGMGMVNEDTLEQNVHIDATFPNVKDAREVEEALNNLVNVASQRIGRNTKR